jgi:hypothetical protein
LPIFADTFFLQFEQRIFLFLRTLRIDGRIILKLIFKQWDGEEWIMLLWIRTGSGGGYM